MRYHESVSKSAARSFAAALSPGGATADETVEQDPSSGGDETGPDALSSDDPIPAVLERWERYEFQGVLGKGGMGAVYRARDRKLGRIVALKFIRSADQRLTRRFIQEARAQARIEHDHICKVHEVGEVEGHTFISMQYIDGVPLSAARQKLRLEDKIVLLATVAEAIHAAHRQGLIHRDVKPSTIPIERT